MDEARSRAWLQTLPVSEIITLSHRLIKLSCEECRSKDLIIDHLLSMENAKDVVLTLCQHAEQRSKDRMADECPNKRRRNDGVPIAEEPGDGRAQDNVIGEVPTIMDGSSKYLDLPSDAEVQAAYQAFYQAMSSASVNSAVCGVCARECGPMDDELTTFSLVELPNSHRLIPLQSHPFHDLYDAKLLEPAGVEGEPGNYRVKMCRSCLNDLSKKNNIPPRYALANNLWIGRIPWQIQVLTFLEQLLVSLVYPRIFVFKLFPKKVGGVHDLSQLQRAMCGNVTSYAMDTKGVASMVDGRLVPQHPRVLASLISVTYIGPGELPKAWLRTIFCVRRAVVHDALKWLKAHNPYYRDIEISDTNLNNLPEDDVPTEISSIMRHSSDVGVVDQENDGYVQDDEVEAIPMYVRRGTATPAHLLCGGYKLR